MKQYGEQLVQKLQNSEMYTEAYGTTVRLKPIPDDDTSGVIDSRV